MPKNLTRVFLSTGVLLANHYALAQTTSNSANLYSLEVSNATLTLLSPTEKPLFEVKCQDSSVVARPLNQPVLGKIITPKNGNLIFNLTASGLRAVSVVNGKTNQASPDSLVINCDGSTIMVYPGQNVQTQWRIKPASN